MNEVDFLSAYQRLSLRWWWPVMAALLLSLLGALLATWSPPWLAPVYQAEARLSLFVDLAQTGSLSDRELDFVYQATGQVIAFDPLVGWVVERARVELGLTDLTPQQLRQWMRLERRHETWRLQIRHADPALAVALVNLWAEEAHRWLSDARASAQRAQMLSGYLQALADCPPPPGSDLPAICTGAAAPDAGALADLQAQLQSAQDFSYTVSAALMLGQPDLAALPLQPLRRSPAVLIFSAAGLGFCLGAALAALRPLTVLPPPARPAASGRGKAR